MALKLYKRNQDIFTSIFSMADPLGIGYIAATWSSDDTYLAMITTGPMSLSASQPTIYKRVGDTFTLLSTGVYTFSASSTFINFSPDDNHLVANDSSNTIYILRRSGDTFTLLQQLSVGLNENMAYSPDGLHLAIGGDASPYLRIYKRNGDNYTALSITQFVSGSVIGLSYSNDGKILAVSIKTSPFVIFLERNSDTYTKIEIPELKFSSLKNDIKFCNNGKYFAGVGSGTESIAMYQILKTPSGNFTAMDLAKKIRDKLK